MPKGYFKVVAVLGGVLATTGCLAHIAAPFTFIPLFAIDRFIYVNEGLVGQRIVTSWHILTWITYFQIIAIVLQLPSVFMLAESEDRKKKNLSGEQLKMNSVRTITSTIVVVLLLVPLTWLHFPMLRGVSLYPGVRLQNIVVGIVAFWGLIYGGGMVLASLGEGLRR